MCVNLFHMCQYRIMLIDNELSGPLNGTGSFGRVEPNCKQLFKSFVTKSPSSI